MISLNKVGKLMKKSLLLLVGISILVSGCVEQAFHVKQNIRYRDYEKDAVECRTEALQNVPNNSVTTWMPYVGIYTTDTNLVLRENNYRICMQDRGYQEATIQPCTGDAAAEARSILDDQAHRDARMSIQPGTCYVGNTVGLVYFYNAGPQ